MRASTLCLLALAAGCGKQTVIGGSAMMNMMPPKPPEFVGSYDFDLLDAVQGQACAQRSENPVRGYWIAELPFAKSLPKDALTTGAIASATIDAIGKNPQADTIVLTRVVTQGKPDEVCAFVVGRAVRLKKGQPKAPAPPAPTPAP